MGKEGMVVFGVTRGGRFREKGCRTERGRKIPRRVGTHLREREERMLGDGIIKSLVQGGCAIV